jgi:uncharacterized membrane protein YhaH (DUF805 family)
MYKVFKILFSLKGSISRKELWLYSTIVLLLFLLICFAAFFVLTEYLMNRVDVPIFDIFEYYKGFIILFLLMSLLLNWIFLALGVKRSHDLNEKGITVYITFFISILILCASFVQAFYIYGSTLGLTNISIAASTIMYINYFIYITSTIEFILFIYLCIHLGFKKGRINVGLSDEKVQN